VLDGRAELEIHTGARRRRARHDRAYLERLITAYPGWLLSKMLDAPHEELNHAGGWI
jgi:hypothetical protein